MLRYLDDKFYGQSVNVAGETVLIGLDGYVRHAVTQQTLTRLMEQPAFWAIDSTHPVEIAQPGEAEANGADAVVVDSADPAPEQPRVPNPVADMQMPPNATLPPQSPVIAEPQPLSTEQAQHAETRKNRGRPKKVTL